LKTGLGVRQGIVNVTIR